MSAKHPPPASRKKWRILIVDDHPMTRMGLARVLSDEPDMAVCGEAGDAETGMEAVARLKPDLVVTDITLPGKSGIEFIKDIVTAHPAVLVLAASMHDESLYAERVLRAGGRGYIMKNEVGDKVVETVRGVLDGRVCVSEKVAGRILQVFSRPETPGKRGAGVECLSDREFEVFTMTGKGLASSEIARRLHLSSKTVDTHRLNIKGKLGLNTMAELIAHAAHWTDANQPNTARS
jgi:DNA-binding NarL/FixJ family response regulator